MQTDYDNLFSHFACNDASLRPQSPHPVPAGSATEATGDQRCGSPPTTRHATPGTWKIPAPMQAHSTTESPPPRQSNGPTTHPPLLIRTREQTSSTRVNSKALHRWLALINSVINFCWKKHIFIPAVFKISLSGFWLQVDIWLMYQPNPEPDQIFKEAGFDFTDMSQERSSL